jgi:hypothetical protein
MKKLFTFIFVALLVIQFTCLVILQVQGHKINWLAAAILLPGIVGYGLLRVYMMEAKRAIDNEIKNK